MLINNHLKMVRAKVRAKYGVQLSAGLVRELAEVARKDFGNDLDAALASPKISAVMETIRGRHTMDGGGFLVWM